MISLQRVSKMYKNGVVALDDVSIEVEKGEFVFLVGPSGSGKSSSLRLLLREEDPTSGEVFVAGKNLSKLSTWSGVPKLRRNLGTVFQDFKLLQDKTVFENVSFGLEGNRQAEARDRSAGAGDPRVRGAGGQAEQLPR
jgi:cell division transport system ATP-binding protein